MNYRIVKHENSKKLYYTGLKEPMFSEDFRDAFYDYFITPVSKEFAQLVLDLNNPNLSIEEY